MHFFVGRNVRGSLSLICERELASKASVFQKINKELDFSLDDQFQLSALHGLETPWNYHGYLNSNNQGKNFPG